MKQEIAVYFLTKGVLQQKPQLQKDKNTKQHKITARCRNACPVEGIQNNNNKYSMIKHPVT